MTHLYIAVRQQQIHDDIRAQQLYAVQPPLQASQLLPQLLPTEPLPSLPDILPNGLPEIAADAQGQGREGERMMGLSLSPSPFHPHQPLLGAPSL